MSPASGLQQVPINVMVTVQFNDPVNGESRGQVTLSANGTAVSAQSSLSNGNQTLTLVPAALAANTQYTLTVTGITDLAGNPMSQPMTATFVTALVDFSAPTVTNVVPTNNAIGASTGTSVQIQFNKLMNSISITNSTFTLSSGLYLVPGAIVVSLDGTTAIFTPNTSLAPFDNIHSAGDLWYRRSSPDNSRS